MDNLCYRFWLHRGFDSVSTRILETLLQDHYYRSQYLGRLTNIARALGRDIWVTTRLLSKITGLSSGVIKPRIAKGTRASIKRTKSLVLRSSAPSWLCNQMNNDIDVVWFSRQMNNLEDNQLAHRFRNIIFPQKGSWLACLYWGPTFRDNLWWSPLLCAFALRYCHWRYIVDRRIGSLDRKARVVSEKPSHTLWVGEMGTLLPSKPLVSGYRVTLLFARINVFRDVLRASAWALGYGNNRRWSRPGGMDCVVEFLADERLPCCTYQQNRCCCAVGSLWIWGLCQNLYSLHYLIF